MMRDDQRLLPLLGKKSADALENALDIRTVGELLRHYPFRYARRGELTAIRGLETGEHVTVMAKVVKVDQRRMRNRSGTMTTVHITDGAAQLSCVFFTKRVKGLNRLAPGVQGLFAGKVTVYRGSLQLAHPEFRLLDDDEALDAQEFTSELIPVYPAATTLQSWSIAASVGQVLDTMETVPDPLAGGLREELSLMELDTAIRAIHRPATEHEVEAAKDRLKWDEALSVQLALSLGRTEAAGHPAPECPPEPDGIAAAFDKRLPFELTEGQREVGETIEAELAGAHPMNRLLQGEVGSGKTIVALRAMLRVVDAGNQAALLAPTEVLAAQHARSLREMLGELGNAGELGSADKATRVTLLTGSMTASARKKALLEVVSGESGIVVGTHAIIQETVSFAALGLVVVDEQHRFGVEQRDALRGRGSGDSTPHVLVMTATPIPRTVAMTVYGDLAVSSLRQLPRGRSPIGTNVVPVAEKPAWLERAWQRVTEEVAAGHQAYVVCPRIGEDDAAEDEQPPAENDNGQRKPIAVLELAPMLVEGALRELRVGVLHGQLPADEKDACMRAFAAGELDVLIATTVIEVGVDVPNSTVMVIMDAERFGISQLHQLRGRVGRGSAAGLCLLVTESPGGSLSRERLDAVASTTDGFELAKLDLQLRREGDILGASQSGTRSALKMLSLLRDEEIIAVARTYADSIVAEDPQLAAHPGMRAMVTEVLDEERAAYLFKA
ncbi:ATP-dependent DNA helicase RecG [Sciscionella marina]|uniref:ATP-dependent DNA helicase RecG n=1 Tax=Sciscionella marina TaxID=508770 RepID=UPI00036D8452|nr:ATP-dependent DNA helicase RecG [Sciscionella marina]